MPNLMDSIFSSASALGAYDRVLSVVQNNVVNASTPGWAKQTQMLDSLPFDLTLGSPGGVQAGEVVSARSEYADQSVRHQTTLQGQDQQSVNSLGAMQTLFDVSGTSGLPNALNNLFQSFSNWAQSSTDTNARQTVIDRATSLAESFQQTASGLDSFRQDTERQLGDTVSQVNRLVGKVQGFNQLIMSGQRNDASLHATLEELSQYVDFSASKQPDGSFALHLNGQTPLLIEDRQYPITYTLAQPADPPPVFTGSPAHAQILASDGSDVTSATTGGQLGALLDVRNRLLPSYIGDAYQAGDLNRMAKLFADRVNQALTTGNIADGSADGTVPPSPGVPLFTYDTTNDTNVARTLAVDSNVTSDQLAAISPGPPEVSNGVPLALAALASPQSAADKIDNSSYAQFYGGMAARVGRALSDSTDSLQLHQSTLVQAKDLRQQQSGVSLDEEAAVLVQFQKAYEATSRLVSVLDKLTDDLLNIL